MDKSGPGHRAQRLPLIIERPDLAHPVRRFLAVFFTALAWCLWGVMWLPFFAALGRHLGYALPEIALPSQIDLKVVFDLLEVLPYVIGITLLIILFSFLHEKFKSPEVADQARWRPVGIERLATGAALDPQLLADWQSAQILYVQHGPRGRVTQASRVPPHDGHETAPGQ